MRKLLATLPLILDKIYERILCSIGERNADDAVYAVRILRWLLCLKRPLLLEEIAEAVAIDPERETPFDIDEVLEDPLDTLDICSSIVILTTIISNKISGKFEMQPQEHQAAILAHYSV